MPITFKKLQWSEIFQCLMRVYLIKTKVEDSTLAQASRLRRLLETGEVTLAIFRTLGSMKGLVSTIDIRCQGRPILFAEVRPIFALCTVK